MHDKEDYMHLPYTAQQWRLTVGENAIVMVCLSPGARLPFCGVIANGPSYLHEKVTGSSPVFLSSNVSVVTSFTGHRPKSRDSGHSTFMPGKAALTRTKKFPLVVTISMKSSYSS